MTMTTRITLLCAVLGLDFFKPWEAAVFAPEGYIEFEVVGKRYGNREKLMRNGIALSGNLLFDVNFSDLGKIENVIVSHLAFDWAMVQRHLTSDYQEHENARAILLSGDFVSNVWLKGYCDPKSYKIANRFGMDFWPC
jgi:hypothetical protein